MVTLLLTQITSLKKTRNGLTSNDLSSPTIELLDEAIIYLLYNLGVEVMQFKADKDVAEYLSTSARVFSNQAYTCDHAPQQSVTHK